MFRALLSIFAFSASLASAETLHVDPSHGHSGASGSASDPLRTVTEALIRLGPVGPHTVRLASGTYSVASGETFPWIPRFELTLAGAPRGEVVVDLGQATGAPPSTTAILLGSSTHCAPTLRVVHLTMVGERDDQASSGCGSGAFIADHCQFVGLGAVVPLTNSTADGLTIEFLDTLFEDIGRVSSNGGSFPNAASYAWTTSTRCVYRSCSETNSSAHFYGPMLSLISYDDCVITGTRHDGQYPGLVACFADHISGCTIVGNALAGALISGDGLMVRDSVIGWNGGPDVGHLSNVQDSLVTDGSGQHLTGVITGDPGFVDPARGDLRPRFGSPVVDVLPGDAARLDVRGQPRAVDGDHDLDARADLGAYEMRTLDRPHGEPLTIPLGHAYEIELRGAPNTFTQLLFTRTSTTSPTSMPYGDLVLLPSGMTRIAVLQIGPDGFVTASLPLQGGDALVGLTLGFQALGRSAAAPAGAAFTNGLELVVAEPSS